MILRSRLFIWAVRLAFYPRLLRPKRHHTQSQYLYFQEEQAFPTDARIYDPFLADLGRFLWYPQIALSAYLSFLSLQNRKPAQEDKRGQGNEVMKV